MPRRTLVPLLGVLVLLVGGCSGDSDPAPRADPTPSVASTSPAVESTAPVVETPEAFIRRWLDASVQFQASNDPAEFRSLSGGCVPCSNLIETVAGYYAAGGYVRPAAIDVGAVRRLEKSDDFLVETSSGETRYKPSADDAEQRLKGGPVTYRIRISGSGAGMMVQDFFVETANS